MPTSKEQLTSDSSEGQKTPELFETPKKSALQIVQDTLTNELVIALCGPIGSPLHVVAERLKDIVKNVFEYESSTIQLSDFIEKKRSGKKPKIESHFQRVTRLIDDGNKLRQDFQATCLADLAIYSIHQERYKNAEV